MKSTSFRMKILSGMLSAGIAFSGSNIAFATVKDNGKAVTGINFKHSASDKEIAKAHHAQMKATPIVVIKESVASRVITKAEGDKILEYVNVKSEKNRTDHKNKKVGEKGGLFNDLVTEGILTKEKADALREKMHVRRTEIKTAEIKNGLKGLVDNKVITIDQSNKVQEIMITRQTQRKEMYKKMQNMSENERQEYMKKVDSGKVSPMKVLIDNRTITKEQEVKIQEVLPHYNHGHHGHHHK